MATTTVERTEFQTSRLLEFFTVKDLTMQIGHAQELWPVAVLSELIANSLDACESSGVPPKIDVTVTADALTVQDNGPGLKPETVAGSRDYTIRVSDKAHVVSPTRGQQGNALKCVWAAPFVASGRECGLVEVFAQDLHHRVEVKLDLIAQMPILTHTSYPCPDAEIGTRTVLHWPRIAEFLIEGEWADEQIDAYSVVALFAAFNPHATFTLNYADGDPDEWPATKSKWKKWLPSAPTCPHWYTFERFLGLIAAYLSEERAARKKAQSVRQFMMSFAGLTRPQRAKDVLQGCGLARSHLANLLAPGGAELDKARCRDLFVAMQKATAERPVRSKALGVIGKSHVIDMLTSWGASEESVRYAKIMPDSGMPFVLEVGIGVLDDEQERTQLVGINWTPTFQSPFEDLDELLNEYRIAESDPVAVFIHLACPQLNFTDRGKGRLRTTRPVADALAECFRKVATFWRDAKRKANRRDRIETAAMEKIRRQSQTKSLAVRDAAFEVMAQAYDHAAGRAGMANARQVMYAARPLVLEKTGGRCWDKSATFTQKYLPQFMELYPEITKDWDVVYDARGHLTEPHTGREFGIGTVNVRDYTGDFRDPVPALPSPSFEFTCKTSGPSGRYKFALFVEKEGFLPQLEHAKIRERFDIAVMSTKGMSVTAARELVEELSLSGVIILVMRDFDRSGFSIVHTLRSDTARYHYKTPPNVIDLGLSLHDAMNMWATPLLSEPVSYGRAKKDPRIRLGECGATEEECNFLVNAGGPGNWSGERIELNAMSNDQFIEFVEFHLESQGVKKVVPDAPVIKAAWKAAWQTRELEAIYRAAVANLIDVGIPPPPAGFVESLPANLAGQPCPWDEHVNRVVRQLFEARRRR